MYAVRMELELNQLLAVLEPKLRCPEALAHLVREAVVIRRADLFWKSTSSLTIRAKKMDQGGVQCSWSSNVLLSSKLLQHGGGQNGKGNAPAFRRAAPRTNQRNRFSDVIKCHMQARNRQKRFQRLLIDKI